MYVYAKQNNERVLFIVLCYFVFIVSCLFILGMPRYLLVNVSGNGNASAAGGLGPPCSLAQKEERLRGHVVTSVRSEPGGWTPVLGSESGARQLFSLLEERRGP